LSRRLWRRRGMFGLDEIATRPGLQELEYPLESRIKDIDLKIAETQS